MGAQTNFLPISINDEDLQSEQVAKEDKQQNLATEENFNEKSFTVKLAAATEKCTKYRDDIVGKRILCIPKIFNVPAPSPVKLSSSLWSTRIIAPLNSSSQLNDTENLLWCPIHHHHDRGQQKALAKIYEKIANSNKAGINDTCKALVNSDQLGRRLKNRQSHSDNYQASVSDRYSPAIQSSYSVLKSEHQQAKYAAQLSPSSKYTHLAPDATISSDSNEDRRTKTDITSAHLAGQKTLHPFSSSLTNLSCQLCNSSSQDTYERYLSSLPWRIGTIRAVSHRDINHPGLNLLIEFDMLDWPSRDWYQVRDRILVESEDRERRKNSSDADEAGDFTKTVRNDRDLIQQSLGEKDFSGANLLNRRDDFSKDLKLRRKITQGTEPLSVSNESSETRSRLAKNLENVAETRKDDLDAYIGVGKETNKNLKELLPGAFTVLLIENSICCTTRSKTPLGRGKLWPALIFEPFIDEIGLFDSSITNLSAIEYIEPSEVRDSSKITQPICDMRATISELKLEFASNNFSPIKAIQTKSAKLSEYKLTDSKRYDEQDMHSSRIDNPDDDNPEDKIVVIEDDKCNCWSPRVQFVENSSIYKFCPMTQPIERKRLLFETAAVKKNLNCKEEDSASDCNFYESEDPSTITDANRKADAPDESRSYTKDTLDSRSDNDLNSFRRFLRFFHSAQMDQLSQLPTKIVDMAKNGEKKNAPITDDNIIPQSTTATTTTTTITTQTKEKTPITTTNDLLEAISLYPRLYHVLRDWHLYQDAQSLLGNIFTAASLVGNRIKVYRSSGATQWYTAVIISYDERTNLMTLIDDTVLEEHHEDPALLEMHLIDENLIQSIIEGDHGASNSRATTRCRTQRANKRKAAQVAQIAIANALSSTNSSTTTSFGNVASSEYSQLLRTLNAANGNSCDRSLMMTCKQQSENSSQVLKRGPSQLPSAANVLSCSSPSLRCKFSAKRPQQPQSVKTASSLSLSDQHGVNPKLLGTTDSTKLSSSLLSPCSSSSSSSWSSSFFFPSSFLSLPLTSKTCINSKTKQVIAATPKMTTKKSTHVYSDAEKDIHKSAIDETKQAPGRYHQRGNLHTNITGKCEFY